MKFLNLKHLLAGSIFIALMLLGGNAVAGYYYYPRNCGYLYNGYYTCSYYPLETGSICYPVVAMPFVYGAGFYGRGCGYYRYPGYYPRYFYRGRCYHHGRCHRW